MTEAVAHVTGRMARIPTRKEVFWNGIPETNIACNHSDCNGRPLLGVFRKFRDGAV
jgi:hypothetical protein